MSDKESWKELSEKDIYSNRWGNLVTKRVELTDGTIIPDYVIWQFSDGVMIVGITPNEELVLVKQYRLGAGNITTELPSGSMESDSVEVATKKELIEEVGAEPDKLKKVGKFYLVPSRMTSMTQVILAEGLVPGTPELGEHEDKIEVTKIPLNELGKYILEGKIDDSQSLASIFLALLSRGNITIT